MTRFNAHGKPVARSRQAWPSKAELVKLKVGAGEKLIETVTLTCEYIQRSSRETVT